MDPRLSTLNDAVIGAAGLPRTARTPGALPLIGLVPGEGVGPALTDLARDVLAALTRRTGQAFACEDGVAIGVDAVRAHGQALTPQAVAWFESLFARGGAALCGPGGARFVYDLRRRFDLFCKVSPIAVEAALLDVSRFRPEHVRGVDLLVVRDNAGGVYQGSWSEDLRPHGTHLERVAEHRFAYRESDVRRLVEVAARLAAGRSRKMAVVIKEGGVPTITALWTELARAIAATHDVQVRTIDVDLAAYQLVADPRAFDVIVCPNMIGDVLGDLLGVVLGSRGLTYSGNFAASGAAVYQTNHGSAWDLVGTDLVNPVGHLHALAMLLETSFGLTREANLVRAAIRATWGEGLRTADLAGADHQRVGTRAFSERVVGHIADLVPDGLPDPARGPPT